MYDIAENTVHWIICNMVKQRNVKFIYQDSYCKMTHPMYSTLLYKMMKVIKQHVVHVCKKHQNFSLFTWMLFDLKKWMYLKKNSRT